MKSYIQYVPAFFIITWIWRQIFTIAHQGKCLNLAQVKADLSTPTLRPRGNDDDDNDDDDDHDDNNTNFDDDDDENNLDDDVDDDE